MSAARDDVKSRIDAIEESYEFFLAYAAQGLSGDQASKAVGQLRTFLSKIEGGFDGLAPSFRSVVEEAGAEPSDAWDHLLSVLERDAADALAAVRLVSALPGVSSQLIDNLNANIHLRALLTDLFLLDDLIDAI